MDISLDKQKTEEWESFVKRIPGVISSKIILNSSGEITDIHVLSDMTRSPKQIARDVQSALMAKFDINMDYKVISVAQIDDGSIGVKGFRLSLENIQILTQGTRAEIRVTLAKEDQIFEGTAVGGNSANARPRLVAEAALNAIHSFLNHQYVFILADLQKFTIAGRSVYNVAVSHMADFGEELLIGSCLVKLDENETVVKATLDAVNRRILRYLMK